MKDTFEADFTMVDTINVGICYTVTYFFSMIDEGKLAFISENFFFIFIFHLEMIIHLVNFENLDPFFRFSYPDLPIP